MSGKIIVIDDEPKLQEFVASFLRKNGYDVLVADDGTSGLRLVEREVPDLVISDVLIPHLNGFALCRTIKDTGYLSHIPVILMTGVYKKERYKTEAVNSGAEDYIFKPIDTSVLLAKVQKYVKPKKKQADEFAAFKADLKALRAVYAEGLPDRISTIEKLWGDVSSGRGGADAMKNLHRMVHGMAGSSGTFGFNGLGVAAGNMEEILDSVMEGGAPLDEEIHAKVEGWLARFRELASNPDRTIPEMEVLPSRYLTGRSGASRAGKTILLVDDDHQFVLNLGMQISHFGYDVKTMTRLKDLEEMVQSTEPAAIIMDIIFTDESGTGCSAIEAVQAGREQPIPVLFVSARGDLATRLRAVRAGGSAYFTKPLDVGELIEKLDGLTHPKSSEPIRVVIVEDEKELSEYYAELLNQAGITAIVVNDPLDVLQVLSDFRPDLILMDLYMPGCDGMELAAVIRQESAYIGVPIVFLSVESRLQHQMKAIDLGADDFLTKNIAPQHLISSVAARAMRSRTLRSFMARDGVTGLLNHTRIKEHLVSEVTRAHRTDAPLVFAMLDVDDFKAVNDSYGHPTGDRVLKSLAHLLRQRLRRTDSIGRYGGDEFGVILPNTTAADAHRIMDEIRKAFAQVRHQGNGRPFTVTLSCGLAALAPSEDSSQLGEEADKALYQAKASGKNRVFQARSN